MPPDYQQRHFSPDLANPAAAASASSRLDYAKFACEYKQPPEYSTRMTNDYSKLLPGLGEHRHPHTATAAGDFRLPTDPSRDSSLPPAVGGSAAGSSQMFGSIGGGMSSAAVAAPLSLPAHKRTHPTHSSGPIYSTTRIYSSGPLPLLQQQPASLDSQPPAAISPTGEHAPGHHPLDTGSQRLDQERRTSDDRLLVAAAAAATQDKLAAFKNADLPRSSFSNTLPSLRKRSHVVTAAASVDDQSGLAKNRMSVFEPYPMRDTVQHFCEKHLDKIKSYMESVSVKIPLPVKCTIGMITN